MYMHSLEGIVIIQHPAVCFAAADGLPHMGSSGMALQPSLPSTNPSHERSFRQLSAGIGPGSGASSALAQISAAQLLPRGIHSLYAQNPGALLGSGQAAGMALGGGLGGHTHNSLSPGLTNPSGPMAGGASRYLAGLGMNRVLSPSALCHSFQHTQKQIAMVAYIPAMSTELSPVIFNSSQEQPSYCDGTAVHATFLNIDRKLDQVFNCLEPT